MASWDDLENEETVEAATVASHWEGEDEDDDEIKDNWDDDEEEEKKDQTPKPQPKKKKTIAEKIEEKEEKQRQEKLARIEELKRLQEESRELTPEEQQRRQEEADLEIAKDAFGVTDLPEQKTIDNFTPTNKDEFLELSNMIVQKLSQFELCTEYPFFLETLVRDCCAGFEADDIKKISNTLNSLVQEKQKQAKVAKGKKKPAAFKKTLSTGKGVKGELDYTAYDDFNDYDDFM